MTRILSQCFLNPSALFEQQQHDHENYHRRAKQHMLSSAATLSLFEEKRTAPEIGNCKKPSDDNPD